MTPAKKNGYILDLKDTNALSSNTFENFFELKLSYFVTPFERLRREFGKPKRIKTLLTKVLEHFSIYLKNLPQQPT